MSGLTVEVFPCLQDNYGYLVRDESADVTIAVDAPDATAIAAVLDRKGWRLTHILTTHHHSDHTDGNLDLQSRYGCSIIGPANEADRIPGIGTQVKGGDRIEIGSSEITVIDTPGHTSGHICYYFNQDRILFSGDTLFAMGCGRLLEASHQDMWNSLQKLMTLPDDTKIYFGHEYTAANARFALSIDPHNAGLIIREEDVLQTRSCAGFTTPTTLALEKATNPMLRPHIKDIRVSIGFADADESEVFAEIRHRKDVFK